MEGAGLRVEDRQRGLGRVVKRPEQSPEKAYEKARARRRAMNQDMRHARCSACRHRFPTARSGVAPDLCPACALKGWGPLGGTTRHPLADL